MADIKLKDLRYLVAVADARHFGRAAEHCFVSQPTLSAQLKKLEQYLGVQLIERQPNNVALTEAGEQIVARARRILEASDEVVTLARAHREFAHASPGRWQALQRRAGEGAVRSPAARDVVALTSAVLRGYPVPEADHVHAVRLLGSTINGFLALEGIGSFDHSEPKPGVSWDKMVVVLDATLRNWPTS